MLGWIRRVMGRGRLEDYTNKPSKSIERRIFQGTKGGQLVWILVVNGRGSGSSFVPWADIEDDDVNVQDVNGHVVHIPHSAIMVRRLLLGETKKYIDQAIVDMSTGTPQPAKNFDTGGVKL